MCPETWHLKFLCVACGSPDTFEDALKVLHRALCKELPLKVLGHVFRQLLEDDLPDGICQPQRGQAHAAIDVYTNTTYELHALQVATALSCPTAS